jgi:hypothetical protein
MSQSDAQQITVTMDADDSQTVKMWPPPQVQSAPPLGLSMAGDDQTVEIIPA